MPTPTDPIHAAAVAKIVAAEGDAQRRGITQFAAWSMKRNQPLTAFQSLLAIDPKLALAFVERIDGPVPGSLVLMAAPLLQHKAIPASLRVAVAAKFIGALPDRREAVGPIVRSVTAGLNKRRSLDRLYSIQRRVAKCDALDAIVAETEARARLQCPVCRKSFHRPGLVKHLWKKHHCELHGARLIKPADAAEALIDRAKSDEAGLDRAFHLTPFLFQKSTPLDVLQGLASRHFRSSDQYADLADRAGDGHAGLCPKCYGRVPDPIPSLPDPLTLHGGQLTGDGYSVEVGVKAGIRTVRIAAPDGVRMNGADPLRRLSPRMAGFLFALPIAIIGLIATFVLPPTKPDSFWQAMWFSAFVLIVYIGTWAWRKPLANARDRAVDLAWEMLVPGIGRSPDAVRYLTRLCRTSLMAGDAVERSAIVWELADQSAVIASKGGTYLGFYAASNVLRAVDAGTLGRETVGELATLLSGFFQSQFTAPIGESMAVIVRDDVRLSEGERRRLGILLLSSAFQAGLTPTDLVSLRRFLPALVSLLPEDTEQMSALETLWLQRSEKPWAKAGSVETIFSLCKSKPGLALRALRFDPDALLVHQPEESLNNLLGPVTVNRRGIRFGGAVVADPEVEVTVVMTPTGGELVFGKNTFALDHRPSDALEKTLKRLLRYRAEGLIPEIDREHRVSGRVDDFLAAIAVGCPLCRTESRIRSGQLGIA